MELKIICPKCSSIISGRDCTNCDYELKAEEILLDKVINGYNEALQLIEEKRYLDAWNIIKDAILIYPYIVKPLEFAFYLAVEIGDYKNANTYLNQLKPVLARDNWQEMNDLLLKNVKIYNDILDGKLPSYNNLEDLSYVHLVLLKSKNYPTVNKNEIERRLEEFKAHTVKTTKSKKLTRIALWSSVVALIISVIFIIITTNKENDYKIELSEKNSNLKKFNEQIVVLEHEINNRTVQDSLLFYLNDEYQRGNYTSCANIIISNPKIINRLKDLKLINILENISKNLYYAQQFELILEMNYESEYTPHALFMKLMREVESEDDRIEKIKLFVQRYPIYKHYTAPLLKELFDYYNPTDSLKASEYAVMLEEYVDVNSSNKYKQWYTEEVRSYIEKGE